MVNAHFLNRFYRKSDPDPATISSWTEAQLLKASDKAYARMENAADPRIGEHLAIYSAISLEIERRRFSMGSSLAGF